MKPILSLSLVAAALALVACGGNYRSSHTGTTGQTSGGGATEDTRSSASFRLDWSASGTIPRTAKSVTITLTKNGVKVGEALVARPTDGSDLTNTEFANLLLGVYSATLTVHATEDGLGVALAKGEKNVDVKAEGAPDLSVSFASTVASLKVSSAEAVIDQGTSQPVSVAAYDASGAEVSIADEAVEWSVDDPTVATVEGEGAQATLKGIKAGAVQVSATLGTISANGAATVKAAKGTVIIK